MTHARRTVRMMLLLVSLLPCVLAACAGGSGSSGFDAAPQSESAAISKVLAEQECVTFESLQICPVGGPPNGTPPPTHAPPHVTTGLDRATSVGCMPTDAATCTFLLPFSPEGFPPTTTFRIAVHNIAPNGRWHIGETLGTGNANTPDLAGVDVPQSTPDPDEHVQLAILAFVDPPHSVPTVVTDLADSGADFAFVTNALTLLFNL